MEFLRNCYSSTSARANVGVVSTDSHDLAITFQVCK